MAHKNSPSHGCQFSSGVASIAGAVTMLDATHNAAVSATLRFITTPLIADDSVQRSDVAAVRGPSGIGEAEPDPLPGVAHGAALRDVAGVGERGDVFAQ